MMYALALAAVIAPLPRPAVSYEAQSMRLEPRQRRAVLDGAVRLRRGDLVVTGDHAVVVFGPEEKPSVARRKKRDAEGMGLLGQSLERFTVDGHVHVQRGARTADAAHGELDEAARTLVLTGSGEEEPVLRGGTERLSGDRIVMQLDSEDLSVVRPRLVLRRSAPEAQDGSAVATRVEADRLFLDRSERLAHFTDDVVVRRGDVTVRGPRMDAHYDETGQVTILGLRGGVEMRQADRRAVAQNADYDARTRELVLTGQPRLYDGDDVLVGEKIGMALDSKQVRVERAHGKLRPDPRPREVRP
jgi:lipopolysaccharide export system protein LptA